MKNVVKSLETTKTVKRNARKAVAKGCTQTVEQLAYQLWEEAGHPNGQSDRFWAEAEAQLSC